MTELSNIREINPSVITGNKKSLPFSEKLLMTFTFKFILKNLLKNFMKKNNEFDIRTKQSF